VGKPLRKKRLSGGGRARSRIETDPGIGDDTETVIADEPSTGSRARSKVRTSLGVDRALRDAADQASAGGEEEVPADFAERMGVDDKARVRETAVLNVDQLWTDSNPGRASVPRREKYDSSDRWSDPPEPLPEDDLPEESGRFEAKLLAADGEAPLRHVSAPPASTAAASVSQAPDEAAPSESRAPLVGLAIALALAVAVFVLRLTSGPTPAVPAMPSLPPSSAASESAAASSPPAPTPSAVEMPAASASVATSAASVDPPPSAAAPPSPARPVAPPRRAAPRPRTPARPPSFIPSGI
jgi:hypothetical protein